MSCGGRVYKGDIVEISVPFDVEDYTSLSISFFTNGDTKIVIDNPAVVDGFIETTFNGSDLDLLPDGVLRYVITYTEDGEEHTISTNTSLVLKTPPAYSALTPTDYYLSGYTAGQAECSGDTPCDCTSAITQAYLSGYSAGQADCSGDTPCDCTEAFQSGYTSASNYYKRYRRNYVFSGTITFNRDFTYGEIYHYSDTIGDYSQSLFGTFMHGTTYSGTPLTKFNEAFQEAGGIYVHTGAFWSAGTYPYSSEFELELMYEGVGSYSGALKDGYVELPVFFNNKDGHIDVKLYFKGDSLD